MGDPVHGPVRMLLIFIRHLFKILDVFFMIFESQPEVFVDVAVQFEYLVKEPFSARRTTLDIRKRLLESNLVDHPNPKVIERPTLGKKANGVVVRNSCFEFDQ